MLAYLRTAPLCHQSPRDRERICVWIGYLRTALLPTHSSGADYVFIPEKPPAYDDWESELCEALRKVGIILQQKYRFAAENY